MASDHVKRKLAAIVAADVVGYSRLMGADEAGTLARLKQYRRELIDPKNRQYRGRVVKTTGDGILIEFPSVVDALCCSIEVQQGMHERNADVAPEKRIEFLIPAGATRHLCVRNQRSPYRTNPRLPFCPFRT